MTSSRVFLLDTGPALNFCATDAQDILLSVLRDLGTLAAPEAVDFEFRRKAEDRGRFRNADQVWQRLTQSGHVEILEASDLVKSKVRLLTNRSAPQPGSRAKDLGETMCIAHALAMRDLRGSDQVVIMDDGAGTRRAGQFKVRSLTTEAVLVQAAKAGIIESRSRAKAIYNAMTLCDDGLVHFSSTELNSIPFGRRPDVD